MSDFSPALVNLKNVKYLKKMSEELIRALWHPTKMVAFCTCEKIRKRNRTNFY